MDIIKIKIHKKTLISNSNKKTGFLIELNFPNKNCGIKIINMPIKILISPQKKYFLKIKYFLYRYKIFI